MDRRHQERVDALTRLLDAAKPLLPRTAAPVFGHMRLKTAARESHLFLGRQTKPGAGVSVIDWQTAPLAKVFFSCAEGEEYELDGPGRRLTGTLLERNLLGFEAGQLVEVRTHEAVLSRRDGRWKQAPAPAPLLRPRPKGQRYVSSPADVELDEPQRRVVELPIGTPALVLGEAGFGKTTVALHRLSFLRRKRPGSRAAVIVPTDGLRRLTQALLERMGVAGVEVALYDAWAAQQARRAFRDLPARASEAASAGVIRLKRHPALRPVLARLARQAPPSPSEDARRARRSTALARREDLLHLFGDGDRMNEVAALSAGALNAGMVREVLEHTHVQFSETTEQEYAHVDAERLGTLDGRAIDDGTPMEDAQTFDAEDAAVLFELDRLRAESNAGRSAAPHTYACLVVDEAQEFAPLELALLGRSVARGGTLIVAGDAGQQVDPTTSFTSWQAAMGELGAPSYQTATLEVSYRCPPEVTSLAREVLGRDRGLAAADSSRPPSPVGFAAFDSELHLVAWLIDELDELSSRDPKASVAVICRTAAAARRQCAQLRRGVGVRLALDGDFKLGAGVNVTCVGEAKGLEFDHVIVPDAGSAEYPDTPEARRALYVAVTRASHQLVLAAVGRFSPLVEDEPRG
jgi:DNA helicase IV